jgi:hypothetical protein
MRALVRGAALVVGVGLVMCLIATLVVGLHGRVEAFGVRARIEIAGLILPGALAVFLGVFNEQQGGTAMSGFRFMSWPPAGMRLPPLDQKTVRTMMRQDNALYAGGVVLIGLGTAIALLT